MLLSSSKIFRSVGSLPSFELLAMVLSGTCYRIEKYLHTSKRAIEPPDYGGSSSSSSAVQVWCMRLKKLSDVFILSADWLPFRSLVPEP